MSKLKIETEMVSEQQVILPEIPFVIYDKEKCRFLLVGKPEKPAQQDKRYFLTDLKTGIVYHSSLYFMQDAFYSNRFKIKESTLKLS